MAARKPSSVFVIVENPQHEREQPGMDPTTLMAWRIPLKANETLEDAVKRVYVRQRPGSTVVAVEDTNVQAFHVGVRLEPVDDPRLSEDQTTVLP